MKWKVPFFDLNFDQKEILAVNAVIKSNWITAGPKINKFEKNFSDYLGFKKGAVAVSSSTAALHISLKALGVKKGDEVILPSLTFVSCANVILHLGAKPVFSDISSNLDWSICPKDVEKKITARTKVIMVVHYAGYSCQMNKIKKIAKKYNIKIIEDCSHAIFSKYGNNYLGTIGDISCFSFFSNKNITTGEGGMIFSRNIQLTNKARSLRSHGITKNTYERFVTSEIMYDVNMIGFNYRMDEIRASIGIEQLKKIDKFNKIRKKIVSEYRNIISNKFQNLEIPYIDRNEGAFHLFVILLPSYLNRDVFLKKMTKNKVQCSIHYTPIHHFKAYKNKKISLPRTDSISKRMVSLPLFPSMTKKQFNIVINSIEKSI